MLFIEFFETIYLQAKKKKGKYCHPNNINKQNTSQSSIIKLRFFFFRRRMRCSTNVYLTALAVVDIIFLFFIFILSLEHYPNIHHSKYELYWRTFGLSHWFCDAACKYIYLKFFCKYLFQFYFLFFKHIHRFI